ncbi:MAG TPA: EAL domain-containing protein, partial [Candidatus Methylomirabilis sp.]
SSLSRLQKLPVDILKIDRSFVKDLKDSDDDREIVRTIVILAQNLSMGVIAEGVESEAQVMELKRAGCHNGQGFLFAEPLSAPAADQLVQAGAHLRF